MSNVNFDISADDDVQVQAIVTRALALMVGLGFDPLQATTDITAAHLNGCPLDLDRMLAGEPADLMHDVQGIRRHLDRETGRLQHHFWPRFAKAVVYEDGWIKIKPGCALPRPESLVLVWHGSPKASAVIGMWVPRFCVEDTGDSCMIESEFDEARNEYYWPEGWYTSCYQEETSWLLEGATHWRALPAGPAKETS